MAANRINVPAEIVIGKGKPINKVASLRGIGEGAGVGVASTKRSEHSKIQKQTSETMLLSCTSHLRFQI